MPRHKRSLSETRTYHVIIKGADRQVLFEEKKDYLKYLDILAFYKQQFHFEIFAYCLMSNHVHLLIRHPEDCSLQSIFRHINTRYAMWFNMKYSRTGFLQDDRYFSEPIENGPYFYAVIRYIHFNPANAGLEKAPGQGYPWTSYHEYISGNKQLTDTRLVLKRFGTIDDFKAFHNSMHDKEYPEVHCPDIDEMKKRLPDDVAREIILEVSQCKTSTDFQNLPINKRNQYISETYKRGVSVRQLNRLTGISVGVINKVIKS